MGTLRQIVIPGIYKYNTERWKQMYRNSLLTVQAAVKVLLPCCLFTLSPSQASAAKALKGWNTLTQPDGTTVTVELCGDEWNHYYRTRDGQTLVLDDDGWLRPPEQSRQPARAMPRRKLPTPTKEWDPERIYKTPVILVAFSDRDFRMENANEYYNNVFNVSGYNEGKGPGCVADYFKDQSGGLFNPQFDVYGPIKVSMEAKSNGTYGTAAYREALTKLADSLQTGKIQIDFSEYDWDGNGYVEQVIYVYAGYGANEDSDETKGCIWPSTGSFDTTQVGDVKANSYTGSAELFYGNGRNVSCGIGTICHEFSHCLGLPDMYPTPGTTSDYSVVDEYDLMDGGNFVNAGWCPPNYSAHEREYMGWLAPLELDTTQQITGMASLTKGGDVYKVVNNAPNSGVDEYYLLENRQWEGWDFYIPNHGLLITHIDFNASNWTSNTVNSDKNHRRMEFVHACGLNYMAYENLSGLSRKSGRSPYLRYSVYPYISDTLEVRALTDTTRVAATVFNANEQGEYFMGKPIMNIRELEDGTISFNFFASNDEVETVGIANIFTRPEARERRIYDLAGRRQSRLNPGLNIVVTEDGKTVKLITHN